MRPNQAEFRPGRGCADQIFALRRRTSTQVCVYGELTDSFEIRTDVRQGCTLSPTIFNYAIDWIMDIACRHSRGVQISAVLAVSQDRIHLRSNTTCVNTVITKRRLRWLRQVLRRPPQELTYISLFAKPCDGWRQKRGGPTWTDTVIKNFERVGRWTSNIWA
ncbi:unnamed protein product [Dracunculus medinensis]|uniref:Reverse transcriptase domain-containing protein n=1 Tax=Dracunculus medinensis TaxID=318479 RepID=A0A0N4UN62_DRAME|nr:unnamed protein product [Dracunculus medinensis]